MYYDSAIVLSDIGILKMRESGEIKIDPFDQNLLQPASYDCRVGRVLVAGKGVVDPRKEKVVLRTGDWAEIETLEELSLPTDIACTYGLRSSLTRRGIDWFGGPQIDPGYHGKIFISVFNPTSEALELEPDSPFCTLAFHRLETPASKGYEGKFQGLTTFPEEDVVRMLKLQSPTLADVVVSVGVLEKAVNDLITSTRRMAIDIGWMRYLLTGILIALVVGLAIGLPLALTGN